MRLLVVIIVIDKGYAIILKFYDKRSFQLKLFYTSIKHHKWDFSRAGEPPKAIKFENFFS